MTLTDDDFAELRQLKAELAARHKKLVRLLVVAGLVMMASALVLYLVLPVGEKPELLMFPLGLLAMGVATLARGVYSALTDVDTKARDDGYLGVADMPRDDDEGESQ